jgi:hypothetical protein
MGLIVFFVIAFVVLIPLLSSADPDFARAVEAIYESVTRFFSLPFVYKLLFAVFLSAVFFTLAVTWGNKFGYDLKEKEAVRVDPIAAGIALGGIIFVYLLFLWIQISRLWVGSLPFDFKTTENLVKSGFWQLFFLTLLNILIYFFVYKKTAPLVQKMLVAFAAASLLLLFSAGQRMGLYVFFYGFSYEKFYASYTVLYCALLFSFLIRKLIVRQKTDVFKLAVVLFIWMYGAVAVFPSEQFIFRSNIALARRDDTRIKLYELSMLSSDVLSLVKKYKDGENFKKEEFDWASWIESREKRIADKKWHERNIMNMIYSRN